MVEQAVHLWGEGKTKEKLGLIVYRIPGFIRSSFPGWTDTIANNHRLTDREKVYVNAIYENNRPMLLRPEQNKETPIELLVNKCTKPCDLVFDPFSGFYSTGCACFLYEKIFDAFWET